MFESILSIDLGAAYTKIAYRAGCAPQKFGKIEKEAKLLIVDGSPLIPSLAIHTRNRKKPWIFGQEAAGLNPDREMEVFQNWKADLFRPKNDRESATAGTVAGKFFEWLRPKLEAAGIDLKTCQTRVAMPAFDTYDSNAALIARHMDLNGWDDPALILKVKEPHANTIGLFSKGQNVVGRNKAGEFLLNYGRMFGHGNVYISTSRGFALHGTHGNLVTVMVLDIGAFTTDIAALTFDVTSPDGEMGDGLSDIRQESHALGVINELDKPLFAALADKHGFIRSELSFDDSERLKSKLYQGQPYNLLTRSRGILKLGGDEDSKWVAERAEKFAEVVWERLVAFMDRVKPAQVFITGGGSLIRPVAATLAKSLNSKRISMGFVEPSSNPSGSAEWRSWQHTGEGLQRLATALGGASVILQAETRPTHQGQGNLRRRPPIRSTPPSGFVSCRCQGGNKDCCFCGGRGFYSR